MQLLKTGLSDKIGKFIQWSNICKYSLVFTHYKTCGFKYHFLSLKPLCDGGFDTAKK
ncbi:MAG: hypothetical protein RIS29_291 [Bacteroidota bacterium]|jgi:hypothetical protein